MTIDKRTLGIRTGKNYPEDLKYKDIEACNFGDKSQTRTCVQKFKQELDVRKIKVQGTFDDYVSKLAIADAELTAAKAALAAANTGHRSGTCWQGYSPELNAACVQTHQNLVKTKQAQRDKLNTDKEAAATELSNLSPSDIIGGSGPITDEHTGNVMEENPHDIDL